jgi:hypothetical protein
MVTNAKKTKPTPHITKKKPFKFRLPSIASMIYLALLIFGVTKYGDFSVSRHEYIYKCTDITRATTDTPKEDICHVPRKK